MQPESCAVIAKSCWHRWRATVVLPSMRVKSFGTIGIFSPQFVHTDTFKPTGKLAPTVTLSVRQWIFELAHLDRSRPKIG